MAEKIVVTAIGIISALGYGQEEHIAALRSSKSGMRYPRYLQSVHAKEFVVGEADKSDKDLAALMDLPTSGNGYTRTTLLALTAVKDLLKNTDIELLHKERTAFINADTVGGMCSVENMYMDFIGPDTKPENLEYIDTLDCSDSTRRISKYYKIKPFEATISTACSSSANALILGHRMITQGLVKRAICGGCDALSRFTLNGFNSLKNVDRNLCRPFDQNRMGLNLGEGAGYLMLETEASANERGAEILAVFSGYANSNDAYHPTAPSPHGEGAYRTMKEAIEKAGLRTGDISYINAHGTATQNNDQSEGEAIETLFTDNIPYFSSTKPYTGHTLAAAGVIEAILSIYGMQQSFIIPNLNFETRMEGMSLQPTATLKENINIAHILSNSFGFGGNNVSLVFSKS
ncbi:MAG: beta-ketoacyl-[acyl-carrier-protein] synthase family protein [Taibaiella sp.]|nr:beta-ketoacyl-[acyl-carrier-protein] synthase family protein [Taibaiella sp.]